MVGPSAHLTKASSAAVIFRIQAISLLGPVADSSAPTETAGIVPLMIFTMILVAAHAVLKEVSVVASSFLWIVLAGLAQIALVVPTQSLQQLSSLA